MANGIIFDDPATLLAHREPLDSIKVGLLKKGAFIKIKSKSDYEWIQNSLNKQTVKKQV